MFEITRRRIAITALATLLLLFVGGLFKIFGTDPGWNQGKEPWNENPSKSAVEKFNPDYTMLLYLDVQRVPASSEDTKNSQLQIRAVRLQFPAIRKSENGKISNTWDTNRDEIVKWINFLNGDKVPTPCTVKETCGADELWVKYGLSELKFNRPHHFVVYIRNAGVEFDEYPMLLGGNLRGTVSIDENGTTLKGQKGEDNWSFFAAKVKKDIPVGKYFSTQLLYVKNYYQVRGFLGLSHKDITSERPVYSLNINALVKAADAGTGNALNIPLVIDPDTGNMGGGDPT